MAKMGTCLECCSKEPKLNAHVSCLDFQFATSLSCMHLVRGFHLHDSLAVFLPKVMAILTRAGLPGSGHR
jgi:hypothetical protein